MNYKTTFWAVCLCLLALPAIVTAGGKNKGLSINPLGKNCYVYTTYGTLDDGSRYPSNSMYVVTAQGIVMIDVPWDTTQTERFLRLVEKKHRRKVIASISTHFHKDRTGGLDILKRHGIKTYSTTLTASWCRKRGEQVPDYHMDSDTTFDFGDCRLQTFYPGKGHTDDNIVVWIPEAKVLYGGCFVKSTDAPDLGNLEDATPSEWVGSMQSVQQRYPAPACVIPGHGSWTDVRSLEHTQDLLQAHLKEAGQ